MTPSARTRAHERGEPNLTLAALDAADLNRCQPCLLGKVLLRPTMRESRLAHIGPELLDGIHRRLRKPDTSAIWAPNANAYVCDTHARSGARVTVLYEATDSGRVELRVQGGTEPIVRRATITH